MTKNISTIAKERFTDTAKELVAQGYAKSYLISESDGVSLKILRHPDAKELIVKIYPNSEAFARSFDKGYESHSYAYEEKEQLEELEQLISDITFFMKTKDYKEKVYTIKDKIVFRELIFPNGAKECSSEAVLGKIRRRWASAKTQTPAGVSEQRDSAN